MKRRNIAVAAALITALTFAGGTAAQALWSSSATAAASATAGSIGVTVTGPASLSPTYALSATSTQSSQSTFTVKNTGTVAIKTASITFAVTGTAATEQAISVVTWAAQSDGSCGTAPTSTSTLAAPPTLQLSDLASGSQLTYCIKTTFPATAPSGTAGTSVTVTPSVTAANGAWTATGTGSAFTQQVASAPTPQQGTCVFYSASNIAVTWNGNAMFAQFGDGPWEVFLGGWDLEIQATSYSGNVSISNQTLGKANYPQSLTGTQTLELRNTSTGTTVLTASVIVSNGGGRTFACP
ncbi:hypothetical protein [Gryllotalpicola ginsengisoli]|uniref:hypothetical protein n=1 Tax=Gryllotalpicola ginsengisoli TaxID=444608 RepID=UPI0003B40968|nr:hypothetical protein [Gryllotalpicola ginsengisoli]